MSILDLPLTVEKTEPPESIWSKLRYHLARNPLGLVGAAIMALFVFCAIFADFITAYGPTVTDAAHRLLHPGSGHVLGTIRWGATYSAASSMARASRLQLVLARRFSALFSASRLV